MIMKTPKELMQLILDETYIMKSAIEIEDLEVVLTAIDSREQYINALTQLTFDAGDTEIQVLWQKYKTTEAMCNTMMQAFKTKIYEDYTGSKVQHKTMVKTKNVHDRYQLQTKDFLSGQSLDQKK